MAALTNKLHIKEKNGTVHELICYTTEAEAKPVTISGGSVWQLKNNNTVCYVGLAPVNGTDTGQSIKCLKIKKNNIEYYPQNKVINQYTVTITQSANQTIKVTCGGQTYTSTFKATAGSQYTVTVTPNTGYVAGKPSSTSGYVNSNITITASAASKAQYLITITQSAHQTITVTCNNKNYTSNFSANYGDKYTATIKADTGYIAGKLSSTSGTITGTKTISATAATIIQYTVKVTQPNNGDIYVNDKIGTSFAFNYNTSVKIEAKADDGYMVSALYVNEA